MFNRYLVLALGTLCMFSALAADWTQGEVRKADATSGRLTLRHAEIQSLDMPAMTMSYRVRDPQWTASLHEGDKVEFTAEKVQGYYTVTDLRLVKVAPEKTPKN